MAFDYIFLTRLFKNAPVTPKFLTSQLGTKNVDYSPLPKVRVVSETHSITMSTLGRKGDPRQAVKVASGLKEVLMDSAQIWEYEDLTEEEVFASNSNPSLLAVKSKADVVNSLEYLRARKAKLLKQRVSTRIEYMYAELISKGQITYSNGENVFTSAFVTPTAYSLTTSTKIYSDLKDQVMKMKAAGFIPSFILVTPGVERALWDNAQFGKLVSKTTFNLGTMQSTQTANAAYATFVANLNGLPPIYSYDGTFTDNSGTSKHFIDAEKIVIVSTEAIGTGYGAVINFNVDKTGSPIVGDVVSWEEKTSDGSALFLNAMSRPLPYIQNSNGVVILNTTIA